MNIIVFLCSAACLLVYVPVVLMGINQMRTRDVTFSFGGSSGLKVAHFDGAAAVFFGMGQVLSGSAAIIGVMLAMQNTNLLFLPASVAVGALIAYAGLWVARRVQRGEYEFDVVQQAPQGTYISTETGFVFTFGDESSSTRSVDDVIVLDPDDVSVVPASEVVDDEADRVDSPPENAAAPDDDRPTPDPSEGDDERR